MKRRVAALERRIRGGNAPLVIIVRGGLPDPAGDPDPKFAIDRNGTRWDRGPDENFTEFCARVMAAAAGTDQHIVIGGLPPDL
jgi:hypothetical protein